MYTSTAVVFRMRQVQRDLIGVLHAESAAVSRLGETRADTAEIARVIAAGGRLPALAERISSQISLAAALPDEDFGAFVTATTLLILNRLSDGPGEEDLFWNWEAFADHYRQAKPPVRAALMNGIRALDHLGLVWLEDGPEERDCARQPCKDVRAALDPRDDGPLIRAIETGANAETAGLLWREAWGKPMSAAQLAGFRHLYERPLSMAPELPNVAPLLPWS